MPVAKVSLRRHRLIESDAHHRDLHMPVHRPNYPAPAVSTQTHEGVEAERADFMN